MFDEKKSDQYCLVLSGGGAKGIYHVGVWKALRELKVPVHAFIGNSIGAIICGFLVQGLEKELNEISDTIDISTIVDLPENLLVDGKLNIDEAAGAKLRKFYHQVMQKKHLDTSPLREMLYEILDEKAIRKSGYDFGVMTVNISDFHPREVFLDEMEENTVIDYILASSAFPGFEQPVIEGKKYIDGGVVNNLPYDMAKKRGYKNIIVVDIAGAGINHRPDTAGTKTIFIKNSVNLGGVLNFNRSTLEKQRLLGYLDTMKVFQTVKGDHYFLDPNEPAEEKFRKQLAETQEKVHEIREYLPGRLRFEKDLLYPLLDSAAWSLRIEQVHRHTYSSLLDSIEKKKGEIEKQVENKTRELKRKDKKKLRKELNKLGSDKKKVRDSTPYFYYRMMMKLFPKKVSSLLQGPFMALFPEMNGGFFVFDHLRKLKDIV